MNITQLQMLATNGLDAATGEPLPSPTLEQIARRACGATLPAAEFEELKRLTAARKEKHLDTRFGVDSRNLAEAGWGVVFPNGRQDELRAALAPLLTLRREQAADVAAGRYRELVYTPGESKARFLARHGAGPGPVDPDRLPYYLLLTGDPAEIPFSFQHQLDVQYAVGRLSFPTLAEYASYAATVVATERGAVRRPRRISLFGADHSGDDATALSRQHLLEPLAHSLSRDRPGFAVETRIGFLATKAALRERLGGAETPALLFTAGHGMGFRPAHPRHRTHQGALLCQDWPGVGTGPISADSYLAADDLPDSAPPQGLIAFFFACYGAGTPRYDRFSGGFLDDGARREITEGSFVARLPQRLLGHPQGGALAVVGHVDRAWGYSFDWPDAGEQLQVFESALGRLLEGYPVGAAMEYFGQRYAELAGDLGEAANAIKWGAEPDFLDLASLWTAAEDARSYVVLGDPAVRLAAAAEE